MKLFTFATSPYARKVRMVLDYKGIAYEPIERCYSLDRREDLRAANARAEVPTLVLDDGRAIADSTIICEYLEQVYPTPALFPADPVERARMRSLEDLCDRTFDAAMFGYWLATVRDGQPEAAQMKTAARNEFAQLLDVLEQALRERDYLCGELSVADFGAVTYVAGASGMEIAMDAFPNLGRWLSRMRRLPAALADIKRVRDAMAQVTDMKAEFEGPDGKVHWRDSRLEWPLRHGFFDFVAREFRAGKMMFPPEAS